MSDEEHEHEFELLFKQPRMKDDVLIMRCDCGAEKEINATEFLTNAWEEIELSTCLRVPNIQRLTFNQSLYNNV